MPQKIKILKLKKPDDYIQNELIILQSLRNKLLSNSDWTQLPDNGLTIKNIMQWRFWRHKIRSFEASDSDRYDELVSELKALEEIKPAIIKRKHEQFVFILHDLNYASLEKFKKSCILILEEKYVLVKKAAKAKINRARNIDTAFEKFIEAL